jgi:hypothetical protein
MIFRIGSPGRQGFDEPGRIGAELAEDIVACRRFFGIGHGRLEGGPVEHENVLEILRRDRVGAGLHQSLRARRLRIAMRGLERCDVEAKARHECNEDVKLADSERFDHRQSSVPSARNEE